MNEYKAMRREIVECLKRELIGPGSGGTDVDPEEEVLTESPLQRYTVGILYPQRTTGRHVGEYDDNGITGVSTSIDDDEAYDYSISTANEYYPSAIGMSFYAKGVNPQLKVEIRAAKYRRAQLDDCRVSVEEIDSEILENDLFRQYLAYEDGCLRLIRELDRDARTRLLGLCADRAYTNAIYELFGQLHFGWKRRPVIKEVVVPGESGSSQKIEVVPGLALDITRRSDAPREATLYTVALINMNRVDDKNSQQNNEKSFFQASFSVRVVDSSFIEYKREDPSLFDEEERSMELLYRDKKTYAIGHGCAVTWRSDNEVPEQISTSIIPEYEVPQLKFDIEELQGEARSVLEMKRLSIVTDANKSEIISGLNKFCETYRSWIHRQKLLMNGLPGELRRTAEKHIEECSRAYERMKEGVELLSDDQVFYAFQLANHAMLMQRLHSQFQSTKRSPEKTIHDWPSYHTVLSGEATWRPFQLAFVLLSLKGLVAHDSAERDIVDLIWFPTGGGKTEAYLGVTAFYTFYRRLCNKENGAGIATIMRYTLRLLTAQQFQRASTLICACELIRRERPDELGKEPITIGLWIGSSSTPNNIKDAFRYLDRLRFDNNADNPFQVLSCPWCGTRMTERSYLGYKKGEKPKRLILFCPQKDCAFHEELPVKVIDEDIYRQPPTLLFSTVDKFALMPWKKEISSLFATDESSENLSPGLIIQDELHLISGPLGTIVGLYETAVDALCSRKGIKPKIISSTATIRRAREQCKALYNREVKQFPPPGISAKDSFFAREASLDQKPGRLYTGLMSSGKTSTTTLVRLLACILQSVKELDYPDPVKDKYWTLVCYFNSLRELGKCSTLANDDIKDQIRRIATRHNTETRTTYEPEELTSRKKSEEIPSILDRMECALTDNGSRAIDLLLASNMISVGVDVDRLSIMTVTGQPKTTSEYIQATSRIGRKYPGLIVTLFDGTKPRDRSHYEQFLAYHQSMYKFVEPTSVTPFSKPARDRALHAVLVSLMRHYAQWSKDTELKKFNKGDPLLMEAIEFLLQRAANIDRKEKDALQYDIGALLSELDELLRTNNDLVYASPGKESLLYRAGGRGRYWKTPSSMRSVDAETEARIIEWNS